MCEITKSDTNITK